MHPPLKLSKQVNNFEMRINNFATICAAVMITAEALPYKYRLPNEIAAGKRTHAPGELHAPTVDLKARAPDDGPTEVETKNLSQAGDSDSKLNVPGMSF